ncbi:MAG: 1-phosphofructokinase, partial [Erysipelotrichaceae bacterium]|nr:1-phosphofructokinase [Erysipelotrichaceae bacterium]
LYKTVGAGDSMLAAFVGQLSLNKGIEEALRYGGATGTAMVMSKDLPDRTLIEEVAEKTEVRIDQ